MMRARLLKWLSRWFVTRAQFNRLLEVAESSLAAPVESGVCCCGNDMHNHGQWDGHSPRDQWDWHVEGCEKTINQIKEGIRNV